jgi:lipopolysaccharide biosynthesis protein
MRFVRSLLSKARIIRYKSSLIRSRVSVPVPVKTPQRPSKDFEYDLTIVAHLFYMSAAKDLIQEIAKFVKESELKIRVLVTTNEDNESTAQKLQKDFQLDAAIHVYENRGRDVFPFLDLAQKKKLSDSALVLKIHTKHPRRLSIANVLDHNLGIRMLNADLNLKLREIANLQGFVASERQFFLGLESLGANLKQIQKLAKSIGINVLPADFKFPAGTMFWATSELIQKLSELNLSANDFAKEPSSEDGTTAHAMERLIGVIASTVDAQNLAIEDLKAIPVAK